MVQVSGINSFEGNFRKGEIQEQNNEQQYNNCIWSSAEDTDNNIDQKDFKKDFLESCKDQIEKALQNATTWTTELREKISEIYSNYIKDGQPAQVHEAVEVQVHEAEEAPVHNANGDSEPECIKNFMQGYKKLKTKKDKGKMSAGVFGHEIAEMSKNNKELQAFLAEKLGNPSMTIIAHQSTYMLSDGTKIICTPVTERTNQAGPSGGIVNRGYWVIRSVIEPQ